MFPSSYAKSNSRLLLLERIYVVCSVALAALSLFKWNLTCTYFQWMSKYSDPTFQFVAVFGCSRPRYLETTRNKLGISVEITSQMKLMR
mmetsp:Transcript_29904/g.50895  ORF Transcript_29904/g.50895 Transcript_29904/m.50895 type:complete len:89 (-) Transcript_29904:471-737(-)